MGHFDASADIYDTLLTSETRGDPEHIVNAMAALVGARQGGKALDLAQESKDDAVVESADVWFNAACAAAEIGEWGKALDMLNASRSMFSFSYSFLCLCSLFALFLHCHPLVCSFVYV